MRFEQLLHETIDEMAGELRGPAAGLAARSIAKGRRIRRVRRLAVAGSAVLAVVAVIVPWTVLPRADRPDRPDRPPVAAGPSGLPGGWVVTAQGDRVLDRSTGEYVTIQQPVQPAPAGNRMLVVDGLSVQVTDVRGTHPVTVDTDGFIGNYSWSPAGSKLVAGITQKEPFKVGFAVIDARTGAIRKHWIDFDQYDCSQCSFTWTRDGKEVVLALAERSGGEGGEQIKGLQLFNAETGRPTRSLAVTARPTGPFAWSPDGNYVLAGPPDAPSSWRVFDLTTGQNRPFPHAAIWVSDKVMLEVQGSKVVTLASDGTVTASTEIGETKIQLGPAG